MQCLKRAASLRGELSSHASLTTWPQRGFLSSVLSHTPTPTPAPAHTRPLHTSAPRPRIPPKDTRDWATYYTQQITIQQAKKTGARRPVAHAFKKLPRTFNVRRIADEKEAAEKHDQLASAVIGAVNTQLSEGRQGRLFAGVRVGGKEYHVKTEDLIVVQGRWAPQAGDLIRLEKVLYVGGRDFTLFGRPLLPVDQCCVEATVVEKTLSHTTIWFKNRPNSNLRHFKFKRQHLTLLRINGVSVLTGVDQLPEVQGVEGRVFGA